MTNSCKTTRCAFLAYGLPFLTFVALHMMTALFRMENFNYGIVNSLALCELVAATAFFIVACRFTEAARASSCKSNKWLLLVSMILGCILLEMCVVVPGNLSSMPLKYFWVLEKLMWSVFIVAGFAYAYVAKAYKTIYIVVYVLFAFLAMYLFGYYENFSPAAGF